MITLQGKYNIANIHTDIVDNETISQVMNLLNQEFVKDSQIEIQADCHAGAGCTIGTVMTIKDEKVCPNLVGVDVGCSMFVTKIPDEIQERLPELDTFIRHHIPHGFSDHNKVLDNMDLSGLTCKDSLSKGMDVFKKSIGSLGGGNHFIEVNKSSNNEFYLVIHTGSRNLGLQVANYHQRKAVEECDGKGIHRDLCYVSGANFENYINDMHICQQYAQRNRLMIAKLIMEYFKYEFSGVFETVHNYIDIETMILRKGAVSAELGKTLIIPMNMRDGSLLCIGKGNKSNLSSAPHGAGRLMSRSKAKQNIPLDTFKTQMEGIYTSSVGQNTLDEAPDAYKPFQSIVDAVADDVEIVERIMPIYNFKSS